MAHRKPYVCMCVCFPGLNSLARVKQQMYIYPLPLPNKINKGE